MITSKRDLKKHIARINDEIAKGVLPAAVCSNIMTEDQAAKVLEGLAKLTTEALSRLNISFDKTPDSFPSLNKYHSERKAYFRTAYGKALADYEAGVNELLKSIKPDKE